MASDFSSESTEAIGELDEKEEGEISLEDVSSSEEGHLNYGYGTRVPRCSSCQSTQQCARWCTAPTKFYPSKSLKRVEVDLILQDAVQGKENRHQIKESGCIGTKHTASTLQEKNDDLVPISSDSDMEIVGLTDKQVMMHSPMKRTKKKKKKKRSHNDLTVDDVVPSSTVNLIQTDTVSLKHETTKSSSRSYHREISPIHRSGRSRITSRSPTRTHRSPMRSRSPPKRSKSPIARDKSPILRKSPLRRVKSPARSPYRSAKTMPRKTSHTELITSHNYMDTHKLLKRVRELDAMGTRLLEETLHKNKERASSLKEKLTNMMKRVSSNSNFRSSSKEKSIVYNIDLTDADDEEDLALLRQQALETKQNKLMKQNDQSKSETAKRVNINDDQDEEDLELRMIALRSAVLKKHQNRVQKGMKSGKFKKSTTRSESPFTQSFLDSIPIPGEEQCFTSPSRTTHPANENNHTEDMDIDTDVEREKEKLPYSPTDKITANVPIDTELLGIQPSDVSFISLNLTNSSPNFTSMSSTLQDEPKSYQGKIIENQSYLPNTMYYTPNQNLLDTTNPIMQYHPSNTVETSKQDFINNSHVNTYENACNTLGGNNSPEFMNINSSQETPYSPTDTPIYDPDLSHALPQALSSFPTSSSSLASLEPYDCNAHGNDRYKNISIQPAQQIKTVNEEESHLNEPETFDHIDCSPPANSSSISPSSMITIDDLPETDVSPLTDSLGDAKVTEKNKERTQEPLYMKDVPDVTKDTNKIPTLINRTLVPAPILKTNKQLQLPLPTKKYVTQQEPSFKSAEMQPVAINEETSNKTSVSFKPIKMTVPQKSHSVLTVPIAFHDSLHEDSINEASTDEILCNSLVEDNHNITVIQNNTNTDDSSKICDNENYVQNNILLMKRQKKKKMKKGVKRKTNSTSNDMDKEITNDSSKNEAPTNISDKENRSSSEQGKDTKDRRESLEEDAEALRAILLASLPKRTKTNNDTFVPTAVTTVSAVSNQVVNQTTLKVPLSIAGDTTSVKTLNTNSLNGDKKQSKIEEKLNNATQANLTSESVKTLNSVTPAKKRLVPITKSSQKKPVKRISIPASTKVVNNAKKFQNTMIQKRLNQKTTILYNKEKLTGNKMVKMQTKDNKWITQTKIVPDTQRIVINLESDSESDSESERQKTSSNAAEKPQPTVIHPAEFQKKLEEFLCESRKKHEQEAMAIKRSTSVLQTVKKDATTKVNKASSVHTSLAVHLPVSQREEYLRLKQKIEELERVKINRALENNSSLKNKKKELSPKPTLPNSPNRMLPKLNQAVAVKSQSVNAQQLNKENCLKNVTNSVKTVTRNIQSNTSKVIDKQGTSTNQTKTISRSLTNLNMCIANENKTNSVQTTNTSQQIHEATSVLQAEMKSSSHIKILTSSEVNGKYSSAQVKNDANKQIMPINDKMSSNDKTVINQNETVSENKDTQSVEKNDDLTSNNTQIDSDASTVILNPDAKQSETTDESTIRLSQYEQSVSLIPENRDDEHFLLFKNNMSPRGTKSIEQNWEGIRKDVKMELNTLINLSRVEQERRLTETEEKLVTQRYTILDDLAEMSGNLRQWHMERDLQTNLVAEVKKLREQLRLAEEKLQVQRNRINSIGPKVVAAHGKINTGRQECFKLVTICSTLGNRIVGKNYKVPEAGAQLLENRLKEVANHTRELSRKKVPFIDIPEVCESKTEENGTVLPECSEISQDKSLLVKECTVNNTTSLNETTLYFIKMESNIDLDKTEEEKDNRVLNDFASHSEEKSTQNDTEKKVLINELNSCDTIVATTSDANTREVIKPESDKMKPTASVSDSGKSNSRFEGDSSAKKKSLCYESILKHFKGPRNTNPNGVLCPYELMGTCSDGDCQFVHQIKGQAK